MLMVLVAGMQLQVHMAMQVHLFCYSKHPCCIISILPITQHHHYTQSMACPPTHPTPRVHYLTDHAIHIMQQHYDRHMTGT